MGSERRRAVKRRQEERAERTAGRPRGERRGSDGAGRGPPGGGQKGGGHGRQKPRGQTCTERAQQGRRKSEPKGEEGGRKRQADNGAGAGEGGRGGGTWSDARRIGRGRRVRLKEKGTEKSWCAGGNGAKDPREGLASGGGVSSRITSHTDMIGRARQKGNSGCKPGRSGAKGVVATKGRRGCDNRKYSGRKGAENMISRPLGAVALDQQEPVQRPGEAKT